MGPLLSYAVCSAIFLIPLYLIFKWLMASERQPRLNRMLLLSIYAVALVAPLMPAIPLSSLFRISAPQLASPSVILDLPVAGAVIPGGAPSPVWRILVIVYLVGVVIASLLSLATFFSLLRVIRRSSVAPGSGLPFTILILPGSSRVAPFSWLRFIMMPEVDFADPTSSRLIILHESCHLRHHHWIDLLVAQAVCIIQWFNPAAWLMRDELRSIHEFQADADVITHLHPDHLSDYQNLLIKKAVGARFPSLANSLNHSNLKKRITMMYKSNPSGSRRLLRAVAVLPAIVGAALLVNTPAVAKAISTMSSTSVAPQREITSNSAEIQEQTLIISDANAVAHDSAAKTDPTSLRVSVKPATASTANDDKPLTTAEVLPKFPGGESAMIQWLIQHIVYPEEAFKNNIQGYVIVKFVVKADGSVSDAEVIKKVDPLLDAEALRVVSQMPNFEPGTVDGKPVSVYYNLPVSFKLQSSPKEVTESASQPIGVIAHGVVRKSDLADNEVPGYNITLHQGQHSASVDGSKEPAIMIDGQIIKDGANISERFGNIDSGAANVCGIPVDKIESITVVRDDPKYPSGLIMISLKEVES